LELQERLTTPVAAFSVPQSQHHIIIIMKRSSSKKGFTLVEIMIVVVIIGLLAAMAIPAFQRVRQNSRQSSMENLVRQISGAADQYMLENGVTSLNYSALTVAGSADYLKGNVVSAIADKMGLSLSAASQTGGNFTIAQGTTYEWTFPGGSLSGTW
jgi:type IV pilus assembly protein PilA